MKYILIDDQKHSINLLTGLFLTDMNKLANNYCWLISTKYKYFLVGIDWMTELIETCENNNLVVNNEKCIEMIQVKSLLRLCELGLNNKITFNDLISNTCEIKPFKVQSHTTDFEFRQKEPKIIYQIYDDSKHNKKRVYCCNIL